MDNKGSTGVKSIVSNWLFIGVVMVFIQVIIGGVTRITDSGLSITEWAVIQGTVPPLNEVEWLEAFEKYKVAAKKQYETLHAGMTISEFKFIYFWEYFHRLWARLIGFVFLIPFLYFLIKRWLPSWLLKNLGIVVLLAALEAFFGWIMVSSGLNDDTRTWVSAYKLVIHLGVATLLFGILYWTWLKSKVTSQEFGLINLRNFARGLTILLFLQILLGGLMAGMRAGLIHPYFPMFVKGTQFFETLANSNNQSAGDIINYEISIQVKAWVQLLHRSSAYLLVFLVAWFYFKAMYEELSYKLKRKINLLVTVLVIQFLLGVLTIVNCVGQVPLFYGVAHQGVALVLLCSLLSVLFLLENGSQKIR